MAPLTLRRMASVFSRDVVIVSSTMGREPLSSPARDGGELTREEEDGAEVDARRQALERLAEVRGQLAGVEHADAGTGAGPGGSERQHDLPPLPKARDELGLLGGLGGA